MALADVKGISFPFRFGASGHIVRSSGEQKIRENLQALISIRISELSHEPTKGTVSYDRVFRNSGIAERKIVEQLIRDAIARNEPRVLVRRVTVEVEENRAGNALIVEVWFKFRETQQESNFRLRVGGDI